ncbi:MAG: Cif family virulence factor, partial [Planctomycetota bacterium]
MTTTGTTSLLEKTKQILEMIKEGKFVEGMEQFYADDAVNEEPTGATIEGKAAIIEHEKNILKQVAAFHGVDVKSVAVA